MFNDLLANMIVSINRGIVKKQLKIYCKKSKYLLLILGVLFKEGFIDGFRTDPKDKYNIEILLKFIYEKPILKKIKRVSTKRKIVYIQKHKLIHKLLYENQHIDGIFIISTVKGMMSHNEAILKNLGGQIICKIL
jgi:small subunit ribosomal protein S8